MRSLLPALTLVLSFAVGCTDNGSPRPLALPEPTVVAADRVPEPGEEIYYLIHQVGDPEPALLALLESNVWPLEAWSPVQGTKCLAPTAVDALVVRLPRRDDRILQLGFIAEPGPWLINCGVDSLWEYAFH